MSNLKNQLKKSFEQLKIKSVVSMKCACCGSDMLIDKESEKIKIYKCRECSLSNTELKKNDT